MQVFSSNLLELLFKHLFLLYFMENANIKTLWLEGLSPTHKVFTSFSYFFIH